MSNEQSPKGGAEMLAGMDLLPELTQAIERITQVAQPHMKAIEQLQRQIDAAAKALQSAAITSQLQQHFASINATQKAVEDAIRGYGGWSVLEGIREKALASLNVMSESVSFQKFDSVIRSVSASAELYRSIDAWRRSEPATSKFLSQLEDAASLYGQWRTSDELLVATIVPAAVPAREQFLSTDMVDALHQQSIYREEAVSVRSEVVAEAEEEILLTLPSALEAINPDLNRLWDGAWQAFRSSNPDRIRHSVVSVRELVTHVLQGVAPDSQIRAWSSDHSHYHDGRPTRRARFTYVLSSIGGDHLRKFLEKEAEACLALVDLLQSGTHSITPGLSDIQLKVILRKVHSMICTLVEVALARR